MDTRTALKEGTLLKVSNIDRGIVTYTIQDEIGRGNTGIVYNGFYRDNAGGRNTVRIKECYPFRAGLLRRGDELIPVGETDAQAFEECKKNVEKAFLVNNRLFHTDGLTNSISNTIDEYTANNTIYIVSTYQEGDVLSCETADSVKACVSIVKSVAATIGRFHRAGYLYLDIKPENIFVLKGAAYVVQLFDFDSPMPLEDIRRPDRKEKHRIFFTKGFAALEQERGYRHLLGRHTDVYGVGALLFYLLFGRTPEAPDCETDAEYRFADCRFADRNYQDRLFRALPDFFHHTLAGCYLDRYQDMDQVIEKLEEIEKYADTVEPFIISSQVSRPLVLMGRERELEALRHWMEKDETNCLFLTGMGGIGKSTLVREYIANCHEGFDAMLYLYYNGSIQKTIADDGQMRVNTIERMPEESTEDYFRRKVRVLRNLAVGKRILLVVDNFQGTPDEDFAAVLRIGWKVIVVNRREVPDTGYATLRLGAIADRENLYALFECYLCRELDDGEFGYLDEIIHAVRGHTLALQLIARQVECSHISIAEAAALLKEKGFSDIAPEKVDYVKDWQLHQDTVARIINVIFQADHMSDRKKALLKALSMFPAAGVDIKVFSHMTALETKDPINELAREGWAQMEGNKLSLHPVIQEVVRRWEWSRTDWDVCGRVMKGIWIRIDLEAQRGNYSRESLREMQYMKIHMDDALEARIREIVGDGIGADVLQEHIQNSDREQIKDYRRLRAWLDTAEGILDYCKRETDVREINAYNLLLYGTVMNMPPDREDYILEHAEEWLASLDEDGWNCAKGMVLDLYDRVMNIYEERKESRMAYSELKKAERIARESRNHYNKGQYYMMLVGYLESITDWYYGKKAQTGNILKLLFAVDKAIWHLKKGRTDESRGMYIEALLSKAHLLTLSFPWRSRKIIRLLVTAEGIVEEHAQEYSEIRKSYYITEAWFCTLLLGDYEKMTDAMSRAEEIVQATVDTPLAMIDDVILPWMAMLDEFGKYEEAAEKLKKGIQLCEKDEYSGIVPYIRKKVHLYACLLDMYYLGGDFAKCREVIGIIDEENLRNREYGVVKEIEARYREEVFSDVR